MCRQPCDGPESINEPLNQRSKIMSDNPAETNTSQKRTRKRIAKQLDIVLLGQAARRSFGLRLEPFWLVVGVLFFLGGVWELNSIDVDLLPIVLILAGGALMLSLFRRGSRTDWRDWCHGTSYRSAERWRCCSWPTDDR
jgi:hypothetical protein